MNRIDFLRSVGIDCAPDSESEGAPRLTEAYLRGGNVVCPECDRVMRVGDGGLTVSCCGHTYKRPAVLLEEIK